MTRKIISQFIIILIIIFTAISIFWFFKTSAVKKQVLAFISDSDGKISAVSVSVSGFPLKQKLVIEDLKFQLAVNLPQNPLTSNDKYQINIKKIEAISSILSGNFKVENILDASIQNQNGTINSLQFNQPPQASFSIIGGELTKLSYQDFGYKILDDGKNILFENGNSLISFESAIIENKYHNKVRVEFRDVGMFFAATQNLAPASQENISDVALPNAASNPEPTINPDGAKLPAENIANDTSNKTSDVAANVQATNNVSVGGGLVKKSFILDLEYVMNKNTTLPAEAPAPNVNEPQVAEVALPNKSKLESLTIKDLEISSPLYKININGEISSFPQDGLPISNISVRVEKFNNLLIALKSSLSAIKDVAIKSHIQSASTAADVGANNSVDIKTPSASPDVAVAVQNIDPKLDINIEEKLKEIAKKNPATSEDVAIFDFRQEAGKDLLVNEISVFEIMGKNSLLNSNMPLTEPSPTDPSKEMPPVNPSANIPNPPKPVNAN